MDAKIVQCPVCATVQQVEIPDGADIIDISELEPADRTISTDRKQESQTVRCEGSGDNSINLHTYVVTYVIFLRD